MKKPKEEPKLIPWKCNLCNHCKLYIEGSNKDYCLYGSKFGFKYYEKEDGTTYTLKEINERYLK